MLKKLMYLLGEARYSVESDRDTKCGDSAGRQTLDGLLNSIDEALEAGKGVTLIREPDNLRTHQNSWRVAMERLIELETDEDKRSFWEHELRAMDAMYQDLK